MMLSHILVLYFGTLQIWPVGDSPVLANTNPWSEDMKICPPTSQFKVKKNSNVIFYNFNLTMSEAKLCCQNDHVRLARFPEWMENAHSLALFYGSQQKVTVWSYQPNNQLCQLVFPRVTGTSKIFTNCNLKATFFCITREAKKLGKRLEEPACQIPADQKLQGISLGYDVCCSADKSNVNYNETFMVNTCSDLDTEINPVETTDWSKSLIADSEEKTNNKGILNRLLLEYITSDLPPIPHHKPEFGLRLLTISTFIYQKFCSPIVPRHFIRNMFLLFQQLHWLTSLTKRTELLTQVTYSRITNVLKTCYKEAFAPLLILSNCSQVIYGTGCYSNKTFCVDKEFEMFPDQADPIISAMWKVYELVHFSCFYYFRDSYSLWHKYSVGIMDLWTRMMKMRWSTPYPNDTAFTERILGPNHKTHLSNMEKCNMAANEKIALKLRKLRLKWTTLPNRVRLHYTIVKDSEGII